MVLINFTECFIGYFRLTLKKNRVVKKLFSDLNFVCSSFAICVFRSSSKKKSKCFNGFVHIISRAMTAITKFVIQIGFCVKIERWNRGMVIVQFRNSNFALHYAKRLNCLSYIYKYCNQFVRKVHKF